eukprot:NODE_2549_length_418_cov_152.000000_g2468_i0.p3 GENE.NODE_2549_length_418_cov_152.000000_g2468_i0~~NODE_2549_length_418_cov_152.000000_g2468_i0.p3  ORF type:complete len:54 (-),score=7.36 NODE_2549_length_418_cov_152.000000_g2468_i0:73-234(-)
MSVTLPIRISSPLSLSLSLFLSTYTLCIIGVYYMPMVCAEVCLDVSWRTCVCV